MSDSESLGQVSRNIAYALGDRQNRTFSAVISDAVSEFLWDSTGRRVSRADVMPWVHLAMAGFAAYALSKRQTMHHDG